MGLEVSFEGVSTVGQDLTSDGSIGNGSVHWHIIWHDAETSRTLDLRLRLLEVEIPAIPMLCDDTGHRHMCMSPSHNII